MLRCSLKTCLPRLFLLPTSVVHGIFEVGFRTVPLGPDWAFSLFKGLHSRFEQPPLEDLVTQGVFRLVFSFAGSSLP